NTAPAGRVLDQDPKGNAEAAKDTPVTLIVSSGRDKVAVPDVRGRDLADAANLLGQSGFPSTTRNQASDTVAAGKVITTDPPAGQRVDRNSLVTIVVSTGSETAAVPNVVGESQAQATADLQRAGFGVDVKSKPAQNDSEIGNVVKQDPAPDTKATRGSTVTITVGSQP
ncbi:MAG TPA: PASTA domain-containing protein, partial [Actinomycetota bacterium]|nr:PASTA domain-containing protein [Actinomycetota bacterium]